MDKLEKALAQPFATPVYYFASTEEPLLREAAAKVRAALLAQDDGAEATRCDGPAPDLGEVIAAAGAISFFGTPRVVELWEIQPQSIKDKDAAELAELFGQLENAVLIVTCLYKDKKTAASKKAKLLFDAADKAGYAAVLNKPTRRENVDFLHRQAAACGARYVSGAAEALLDRAGEDRPLLESETAKLAAMAGYGDITRALVDKYGAINVEADVFQLSRMITAGRRGDAQEKLAELLALRHEPLAIAGALAGSFADMYRVRAGTAAKRTPAAIAKELGYNNDWRVQKAKESAARYSTPRLRECVLCLARLDRDLKSSALHDKTVLVQAAVAQLLLLGER